MIRRERAQHSFFSHDTAKVIATLGKEALIECLRNMLMIRNFETRAEACYLQGKIGGFFHAYVGQEAIQTAAVQVIGSENWWTTTYRCHALALLLGATEDECMAELFGKETGNAHGRGGSMHLYTDRMLGGFGIVGGHLPVAAGAALSSKYLKQGLVSTCFMGDGAVAQGTFHETLNMASLWDLPCIFVIENNGWGMGTFVGRAICAQPIAEKQAPSYEMKSYTFDGMDFFNCYAGFQHVFNEVKETSRPVLLEVITERFKGHSVSDPGLYRSKEELDQCKERDPIVIMFKTLNSAGILSQEEFDAMDKAERERAKASVEFAEQSPWPDPITLEEGIFAP